MFVTLKSMLATFTVTHRHAYVDSGKKFESYSAQISLAEVNMVKLFFYQLSDKCPLTVYLMSQS